tara:strand:- start:230 stop:460 length:231 start_codon:yes stop_codon:yes gene_type:complete
MEEIQLELIKTITRLEWIRDELRPMYQSSNEDGRYTDHEVDQHDRYYHEIGNIRYKIKELIGHSLVTSDYRTDNED